MSLDIHTDPRVPGVFDRYPDHVRPKMENLRNLIIEAAEEIPSINFIEETLKWGEPSYITKHGSTIRMDWKERNQDEYALYFKCTSKLVPSFKAVFGNTLNFRKNRAIIIKLNEHLPREELKLCVRAALQYHKVKSLPRLGIVKTAIS